MKYDNEQSVTPEGFFAWAWREGHEIVWRYRDDLTAYADSRVVEVLLYSGSRPQWGASVFLLPERMGIDPLLDAAVGLSRAIRENTSVNVDAPRVKLP